MATKPTDRLMKRRKELRTQREVFGLDFIDVCSRQSSGHSHREFRLHFLGDKPGWLQDDHIKLCVENTNLRLRVVLVPAEKTRNRCEWVTVRVLDQVCDGVVYHLTICVPDNATPILDPFFATLTFRFDPHTPALTDCTAEPVATISQLPAPEVNYLAKDYATFRQLLLDRMSTTMPDWQERCPADVGVMLVEVFAYAADHLSYYQDAVATEAYLGTARLRPSLRRHARLVDYRIHEGCNARVWVHLDVDQDVAVNAKELFFLSRSVDRNLGKDELRKLMLQKNHGEVFEPVVSKVFQLWSNHNECALYDWQGAKPCLPKGATCAYLINEVTLPTVTSTVGLSAGVNVSPTAQHPAPH